MVLRRCCPATTDNPLGSFLEVQWLFYKLSLVFLLEETTQKQWTS